MSRSRFSTLVATVIVALLFAAYELLRSRPDRRRGERRSPQPMPRALRNRIKREAR